MSRCFPFPPPGYQTAARSDHVDLLAKDLKDEANLCLCFACAGPGGGRDMLSNRLGSCPFSLLYESNFAFGPCPILSFEIGSIWNLRRIISEEKHKERKFKKEKKDKEKRESKEKKDKDRSKDRHKEKKDGKKKHKDKKKDKDKNRTSDDKRLAERLEGHHEIKLKGNSRQGDQEVHDSKFTEELGRRIRDEEKVTTNSMAENITGSIQRRTKGIGIAPAEENQRFTGTETVPSSINTSERRNNGMDQQVDNFSGSVKKIDGMGSATTMEKDRGKAENKVTDLTGTKIRINHEIACTVGGKPISSMQERFQGRFSVTERGADMVSNTIGTMVPNIINTGQRKNNRMDQPGVPTRVGSNKNGTVPERERGKNINMLSKLFDPIEGRNDGAGHPSENLTPPSFQSATEKVRGRPSQMVSNLISKDQQRNVGMGTDMDSSMEGKKTRNRDTEAFKGDMHKDGYRKEKKNKGKYKDRHKEWEKEKEKMRGKGENKHGDNKPRENGQKETLDILSIKPLAPHIDNANNAVTDGNINKRKDIKINGFLHENVARPNKTLRTSFSSNLPSENGTLEHGNMNKIIVRIPENEDHKIIGIPESRPSSVDLRSPVVGTSKSDVCLKLPHADSKYLNQIYSIPKMEEWPEFDDQEWLFSSDDLRSRSKAKFDTEETPQVWAEAMQIESADVTALPYVIPF